MRRLDSDFKSAGLLIELSKACRWHLVDNRLVDVEGSQVVEGDVLRQGDIVSDGSVSERVAKRLGKFPPCRPEGTLASEALRRQTPTNLCDHLKLPCCSTSRSRRVLRVGPCRPDRHRRLRAR